jgi:hypothetical protein
MLDTGVCTVQLNNESYSVSVYDPDHLAERGMKEVYYLWRLAGGDLEVALKKAGMAKTQPPVNLLPKYARLKWLFLMYQEVENKVRHITLTSKRNANGLKIKNKI